MLAKSKSWIKADVSARILRGGRVIDLGEITSPYTDRIRNWIWKKRRGRQIRRLLSRVREDQGRG